MRLRISTVVIGVGIIVFAIAGGLLTAYALGGLLEAPVKPTVFSLHLFDWVPVLHGAHHIVNIVILMLTFVMVIATLLTLAERKWSALMQNRIGPNRAR